MQNIGFKFTLPASTVLRLIKSVIKEGDIDPWVTGTYKTLLLSIKEGLLSYEPNGNAMDQSLKVCGRYGNRHRMIMRFDHRGFSALFTAKIYYSRVIRARTMPVWFVSISGVVNVRVQKNTELLLFPIVLQCIVNSRVKKYAE